jgi:hypothetical protein
MPPFYPLPPGGADQSVHRLTDFRDSAAVGHEFRAETTLIRDNPPKPKKVIRNGFTRRYAVRVGPRARTEKLPAVGREGL